MSVVLVTSIQNVFDGGVIGFDGADESSWRIGNAKAVRIGFTRSKKQTKINAEEAFALAA